METDNFEEKWNELREFLIDYDKEKSTKFTMNPYTGEIKEVSERYCVALSIDDILKKMDEIEEKI